MRLINFLRTKAKDFSNFPKEYIERSKRQVIGIKILSASFRRSYFKAVYQLQVYYETPKGAPQYLNRTVERKRFRYTTNRPWTAQFRQQNMPGTMRKKVFITPIGKWGKYTSYIGTYTNIIF